MKSFHGLLEGDMAYFFLNGDFCAHKDRYYVFVNLNGCEFQLGRNGKFLGGEGTIDLNGLVVSQDGFKPAVAAWIAARKAKA